MSAAAQGLCPAAVPYCASCADLSPASCGPRPFVWVRAWGKPQPPTLLSRDFLKLGTTSRPSGPLKVPEEGGRATCP